MSRAHIFSTGAAALLIACAASAQTTTAIPFTFKTQLGTTVSALAAVRGTIGGTNAELQRLLAGLRQVIAALDRTKKSLDRTNECLARPVICGATPRSGGLSRGVVP